MTYALVLVKGRPEKRESTLSYFESLVGDEKFERDVGTKIESVFVSFGWPDFVLLLRSQNVELIKYGIVQIRDLVAKYGDNIDTSTIICSRKDEIEKKWEIWSKHPIG